MLSPLFILVVVDSEAVDVVVAGLCHHRHSLAVVYHSSEVLETNAELVVVGAGRLEE